MISVSSQKNFTFVCNYKNGNECDAKPKNYSEITLRSHVMTIEPFNNKASEPYFQILQIQRCTMFYLPYGFEKFFKKLKTLIIKETHLKNISKIDLKEFKHLEIFEAINNDLIFIGSDLFDENSNIKFVNLSNNRILHIHANIIDKLGKNLIIEGNFLIIACNKNSAEKLSTETTECFILMGNISLITGSFVIICLLFIINFILLYKLCQKTNDQQTIQKSIENQNIEPIYSDPNYEELPRFLSFQRETSKRESSLNYEELWEKNFNERNDEENLYEMTDNIEENDANTIAEYATINLMEKASRRNLKNVEENSC